MRKQWIFILALVGVFAFSGCSMVQVRQRAEALADSHSKNIATAKAITEKLNKEWAFTSGLIRKHYGSRYEEDVTKKVRDAIQTLDEIVFCDKLAESPVTCADGAALKEDALKDYRLGAATAAHAKVGEFFVEKAIEEILEFLEKASPGLWGQIVGAVF